MIIGAGHILPTGGHAPGGQDIELKLQEEYCNFGIFCGGDDVATLALCSSSIPNGMNSPLACNGSMTVPHRGKYRLRAVFMATFLEPPGCTCPGYEYLVPDNPRIRIIDTRSIRVP